MHSDAALDIYIFDVLLFTARRNLPGMSVRFHFESLHKAL